MRESVFRITDTPEYASVGALDGKLPVGVADANIWWKEPGWWWLARLKVEEKYQGSGIGSLLLTRLQKLLEGRADFKGILVAPGGYGSDVKRLISFYKKNGFEDGEEEGLLRWKPKKTS